jgi:hypothetical protein
VPVGHCRSLPCFLNFKFNLRSSRPVPAHLYLHTHTIVLPSIVLSLVYVCCHLLLFSLFLLLLQRRTRMAQRFWRERLRRFHELRVQEAERVARLRFTRNYSARLIQRAWWLYNVRRTSKAVHFVEKGKVRWRIGGRR